jgi:hypothetical protein
MKLKMPNLHDRKTQVALGGAGAVVAYALYRRHQAAAGTATAATGTLTPGSTTDALDASSLENNIIDDLEPQITALNSQLGGLQAASAAPKSPVAATPAPSKPASPAGLAPLSSKSFALKVPKSGLPGNPMESLGTITGPNTFTGHNVKDGAPVYALVGDSWEQDFNPASLAKGTPLATFKSLVAYIVPGVSTERL